MKKGLNPEICTLIESSLQVYSHEGYIRVSHVYTVVSTLAISTHVHRIIS